MQSTLLFSLVLMVCTSAAAAAGSVTEPPMAAIKGGTFAMGGTVPGAGKDYPTDQPVHDVRVASFQMAKYEITVGQFRQFVDATGHKTEKQCWKFASTEWGIDMGPGAWNTPAYAPGDYHPVMCVTWNDASAYAAWLSAQTGKPYRLPSEAEWEYAARAGSKTDYYFGADASQVCRYANIRDFSGSKAIAAIIGRTGKPATCEDGAAFTTVVGMYEPNAFGLYDMIGNVGEYVADCEHLNYEGAPADGSAWTTNCHKREGLMKIHRGGSYSSRDFRTVVRGHAGIDNPSSLGEGFRLALGGPVQAQSASAMRFEAELASARAAERERRQAVQ
ncbi:formylglycine-generating enzyme family protein [Massilia atriviolacea]|uniref:Formylglycine-generating enzyme family protein n=1 Tax=Massilia atriviolacea TaxID=2495579 RepID=A0A430HMQ7_9BURK|nr:formylglycine-generating enzyme family protein [Massilia atriviolacea]RSZ58838.1 formylglycine-generating enzyme family protein [Massilia atriviolacea]